MKERLSSLGAKTGKRIDYLEQTTSTNDLAAQSIYGHGDLIIAEYQSKGRGQRGNSWHSTLGQNLTFSMILAADIPIKKQFFISKCVALGIVSAIKKHNAELEVKIKWPNDIYVADKKICGILIENDITGLYTSKSIVGIGLNVNQIEFDPLLPNPTSMAASCGMDFDRAQVLEDVYTAIHGYFGMLVEGREQELSRLYIESLYRYDQWHMFNDPQERGLFEGRIVGIENDGQIAISDRQDQIYRYYFKEVEYKI